MISLKQIIYVVGKEGTTTSNRIASVITGMPIDIKSKEFVKQRVSVNMKMTGRANRFFVKEIIKEPRGLWHYSISLTEAGKKFYEKILERCDTSSIELTEIIPLDDRKLYKNEQLREEQLNE